MENEGLNLLLAGHYQAHLGCREVITNIVWPPRRKENSDRFRLLSKVTGIPEPIIVELLQTIVVLGIGAKSGDEVVQLVQTAVKKKMGAAKLSDKQTNLVYVAEAAALAFWNVRMSAINK